jgi:lysyl-tRNA synthetase class I
MNLQENIQRIKEMMGLITEEENEPEVKKRLRTAFEYIESKKEESKRKTQEMKEGVNLNEDEDRLNQILDKIIHFNRIYNIKLDLLSIHAINKI